MATRKEDTSKKSTATEDTGFFNSEGTAYANRPHSNEPVTSGPYDPTVNGADSEGQIPNTPDQNDDNNDRNAKNQAALDEANKAERERAEKLGKDESKK